MQTESLNTMATGRVTKKILDYIKKINQENKQLKLGTILKKEVNINDNGSSRYTIKEGPNKGKVL
tara:strand:+ start:7 stop:201 length:195 start_codon:yes stop_codon:yes gene_type:complete